MIFDKMFGRNEERVQRDSEQRQMTFAQRQQTLAAATSPDDAQADHIYSVMQDQRSDFLRWQQDLGVELLDLVMTLKGYGVDHEGKYLKVREPICNDKFIYGVLIPQLKPFFSKGLINSNLTESQINRRLRGTMNVIVTEMADSWNVEKSEYGIDFESHDSVSESIKNCIVPQAWRALKGWTKRTDSQIVKRVEAYTDREPLDETQGFFKMFDRKR